MAKNALGKGLGALIHENSVDTAAVFRNNTNSPVESPVSSAPAKSSNIPDPITVDDNGALWIDPNLLKPNPKQPRKEFDQKALEGLSDSIKEKGVLEPVIIQYLKDTKEFIIIAGERRTRASKMAGLSKIPVQLREFDEQEKLELALIENIQRENLNPIEEAEAYYNLIQLSDMTQDEVARKVGKNRATVANAIRLLKLPSDIQSALVNGQISSGHARALLMVKNDSDMHVMFGKIIGSGLSVRQAEELAEVYNNGGRAAAKKKNDKKKAKKDPDVAIFEQELRNLFGVKDVSMSGSTEKGKLEIGFSSKTDFDRIYEVLLGNK